VVILSIPRGPYPSRWRAYYQAKTKPHPLFFFMEVYCSPSYFLDWRNLGCIFPLTIDQYSSTQRQHGSSSQIYTPRFTLRTQCKHSIQS
jgi:hypothetical protein